MSPPGHLPLTSNCNYFVHFTTRQPLGQPDDHLRIEISNQSRKGQDIHHYVKVTFVFFYRRVQKII